jgi:hypothetical protein
MNEAPNHVLHPVSFSQSANEWFRERRGISILDCRQQVAY